MPSLNTIIKRPGYRAAHLRLGKASDHPCWNCGQPATGWAYDHGDPHELIDKALGLSYSLDPEYYVALCDSCHTRMDKPTLTCVNGHPYTPENTYTFPNGVWRRCRT